MSKVRVIAIANQKGGVGKTTTSINLSSSLAEAGKKVLTIDVDPQGNTTSGLGLNKHLLENTIYDVFVEQLHIKDVKQKSCVKGLDVIPANIDLTGAEIELIGKSDKEFIIKNEIDSIKNDYDFIIIDCPPSLNIITINALTASDTVLVPIQCEYFALEGLEQLLHTIGLVKQHLNPSLEIEGIVFTMYDARTNLSLQVVEEIKRMMSTNIYKTIIPRNVRLGEAPSHGLPINLYDAKSKGAQSYQMLAEEVIAKEWS